MMHFWRYFSGGGLQRSSRPRLLAALFLSFASLGYLWLRLEDNFVAYIALVGRMSALRDAIIIVLIIAVFACLKNPGNLLARQKLRNTPSWVFYFYHGMAFAPFTALLMHVLFPSREILCLPFLFRYQFPTSGSILSWIVSPILFLTTLMFRVIIADQLARLYYRLSPMSSQTLQHAWKFSPSAVGQKDDKYEMKQSATQEWNRIQSGNQNISVYTLYGGMGSGKSSFVRMMLESADVTTTLYTYISLTEANQESDFTRLFSERWKETINYRYPTIDAVSNINLLNTVFRDTPAPWMSALLAVVNKIDAAILPTFTRSNIGHVDSKLASVFSNVPSFHETVWVIVIDEIERALVGEIYRTVEVIERFRHLSPAEFPIRLVFILPIDRASLVQRINEQKDVDERYTLINNFLFNTAKTAESTIVIPPIRTFVRFANVAISIKTVAEEYKLSFPKEGVSYCSRLPSIDPAFTSLYNKTDDAIAYAVQCIAEESPRIVSRTLSELNEYYRCMEAGALVSMRQIRIADIALLSLLRVKHPYIIEFFAVTIASFYDRHGRDELTAHLEQLLTDQEKSNRFASGVVCLEKWITSVTREHSTPQNIIHIMSIVARSYRDIASNPRSDLTQLLIDRSDSTSIPDNMDMYLKYAKGTILTDITWPSRMMANVRQAPEAIATLSHGDIVRYANALNHQAFQQQASDILLLAKEIVRRSHYVEDVNRDDSDASDAVQLVQFGVMLLANAATSNSAESQVRDIFWTTIENDAASVFLKYRLIQRLLVPTHKEEQLDSEPGHFRKTICAGQQDAKERLTACVDKCIAKYRRDFLIMSRFAGSIAYKPPPVNLSIVQKILRLLC